MKILNFKTLSFLFIAALALFTSCQKDNDISPDTTGVDPSGSFFSCTLGGSTYECASLFSYALKDLDEDKTLIYGVQNQPDGTIYLAMPKTFGTGAHAFSSETYAYISIDGKAYSTLFGTPDGTLSITKKTDTHVEGTFSFIAYDSDDFETPIIVENGKFDVQFR